MNNTITSTQETTNLPLIEQIKSDFIGLDTYYKIATGETTRRIYMDSTASTLMMGAAFRAGEKFLQHYSNTHSEMHFGAKIATESYNWTHQRILDFVGADPDEYTCFFTGSGVTAGMNRIARALNHYRPEKDIVLVSIMEHHSNDLPHRKHGGKVHHIPVDTHESKMGCIDLDLLESYLQKYDNQVNYVSVTGISNVTGIINPINRVAELAHNYGALVVVDAAQLAAHVPVKMSGYADQNFNVDALLFSGHKTYAPGSPGVVVIRKSFLDDIEPEEVGGGMVDRVYESDYVVKASFPDREEAGTPNIFGAILLGASVDILDRIGMDKILEEDMMLTNKTLSAMHNFDDIVIYGETDTNKCPRAGTISFNIKNMNHGLVAAILNDYYNIAVRNECFCAHPYVEKMLELTHSKQIQRVKEENITDWHSEPWMGMVRVSFGLYNTEKDIDRFIVALDDIIHNKSKYIDNYFINDKGDYEHKSFKFTGNNYFNLRNSISEEIR
ncbi:MAG: aminotransferase class V-fold PLP-dependent enzyme [Candidatus Marinimicrobia bacterium]|nr:aminotransferase class V-fold PLP-dependent enzyme [Candidatus Neomarinimicrobiota bacterium]MBL7023599.1 aminotransferase class V-fold PLP-dependent enzyme [Candidatus Neomarinimicrobiota bacterium]MBL7109529.1 aminotransferase class V-fold PLP-dependent enzyme [Candidatus Neomarinimicrobiota bacterium]